MDERALFLDFWTKEARSTGKVLARIPEGSTYKPDPKSRTAQQIGWQIVCEEKMLIEALETGDATWAPAPIPGTVKEIVAEYERQSADVIARLTKLSDAQWNDTLNFFGHDRIASSMAWGFLFDIVHHRGQITTYLRPMGSTVPQVYGPTADEP